MLIAELGAIYVTCFVLYWEKNKAVGRKSEGNILVVENEERGDVHLCKMDYNKEGRFPVESRNSNNHSSGTL